MSIRGQITFNNSTVQQITVDDILSYSFNSSIGSDGLPLGGTEASSFTLELNNVGRRFTPEQFDDAQIHMYIGIKSNGNYVWSDFGVWYVETSSAPEQSVSIQITGYDALASRFEVDYTDTESAYPTTIGSLVTAVCSAAGVTLKSSSFPNAAVSISTMPVWPEDVTLRDIISWCAICAGGYARIERDGKLAIVSFADGNVYNIAPSLYQTFTPTGGSAFAFNAIEAMINQDDEDYTRFAISSAIEDNPTNTIQVDYNPLISQAIINSVTNELRGITMQAGTLTWGGDPAVLCGDYYRVSTLSNVTYKIMVTAQSFRFDGGLSVTEECRLPSRNTTHSASYSASANVFDNNGNLNATRIAGLDRSIVSATVGHFQSLTSETAEFDRLLSAYISAMNLVVGKLDADVIKSSELYTDVIEAVTAHLNTITAQTITTDALAAAFASFGSVVAQDIQAQRMSADQLAAVMASIVTLTAKVGEFDFATVQNMLSDAMIVQQGYADSVLITNLAVTSANMLDATIGHLVLHGSDGKYYEINVGSDGTIGTKEVEATAAEISAGQLSDGRQIVSQVVNAKSLNGETVKAKQAILNTVLTNALNAGKITAAEAVIASASIPTLYVTSLKALGDSLDISANSSINFLITQDQQISAAASEAQMTAGSAQNLAETAKATADAAEATAQDVRRWMTFDADGLRQGAADSTYSTLTDEEGFHILQLGEKIGSFAKRRLATEEIRIGRVATTQNRCVIREAGDGGLIITVEGLT